MTNAARNIDGQRSFDRVRAALAWAKATIYGTADRDRAQRDAVLAFTIRVASAGILYLMQIVLARWMGNYEYGVYVAIWTWMLVLSGLSPLGLNSVVMRLIPAYIEQAELDAARGLLIAARATTLAVSSAIAIVGLLGLWLAGNLVTSTYVAPLYLAMICLPMAALTDLHDSLGRGTRLMSLALLPPYVLRPLLLLIGIIGMHELGVVVNATTTMAAALFSTWATAVVQTVLMMRKLRDPIPIGPSSFATKSWMLTASPLLVMCACELVLQNADILIMSWYLPPDMIGIYFAAAKTMSLMLFVQYAVGSAVANRFTALHARGDTQALADFVKDSVSWTFWPSLLGALVILATGWPLLWLFGPAFTDAYPVMFVLVLGFLVRAAFGPLEFLLIMVGEQKACAIVLVATAALNIALNIGLIPLFGLVGAASATAVSLSVGAICFYLIARWRLGLKSSIFST